ncbi:MAG TPA: MFS transporter [Candidatus Limnocylindrales bacterium]
MIGTSDLAPRRLATTRGLRAFRHRNYRLFFGGQAISLVGTWMQQVAQAWLVLELTHDPFWLGVTAAAQFLPVMVLGLFAGVAADALPKRQTLMAIQVAMMVLAALLAVLVVTGVVELWMILVLAAALGCANAVDMPVRQAFAVELVGHRDVVPAVALNSAMFNGARVIGPAAAGLAIGAFGVAAAFTINALSFVAVILALAMMRDDALFTPTRIARPRSARAVVVNLADGLRYIRGTPVVLLALVVVGLAATVGMNLNVLIPAYTTEILGGDAAAFGFLMAGSGVGSVIAALSIAFGGHSGPLRIAAGAIILGVAQVALAASGAFPVSWLLMVVVGYGAITMMATANTTIQLAVPNELRGRVMSVYTTIFASSAPVGGLLFGAIASVAGVALAIALGGALAALVGLGALIWVVAGRRSGATAPPDAFPQASGAPSTSAALSPPKPNEVLSTRR